MLYDDPGKPRYRRYGACHVRFTPPPNARAERSCAHGCEWVHPKARAAGTGGIEATDLEVVTVTPTSVTFGFASYTAPHPAYGPLRPTVPTLGEVALAAADDPIVAADPVGSKAIADPAGSWIRPGMPDSPEVSGRITTLTPRRASTWPPSRSSTTPTSARQSTV